MIRQSSASGRHLFNPCFPTLHCAKTKIIRWGALQTSATWVAKAGVEGSSCEYFFFSKLKSLYAAHLRCTRQRLHQLTTNRWRKLLLWRRDQLFPCLFASLCCPVIAAQISLRVSVFFEYGLQFSSFSCSWVKRQPCLLFKWFINDQWFIILKLAGSEGVLSFLLLFSCHYFLEPGWE